MAPEKRTHQTVRDGAKGNFPDTRWSLIALSKEPESRLVSRALQELCQLYWEPVYCFVRRRGHEPEDAEDLTQGFFARFLHRKDFASAQREKGKLRSYLLKSLTHFLSDEFDKRTAEKRGGGQVLLSLDQEAAEEHYRLEPKENLTPELLFEKRWALTLLDDALQNLRTSYEKKHKGELFDRLQPFLAWNASETPIAEVSRALEMTENSVRVSIFRLRRRYREALKQAILDTVLDPSEADEELDYLFSVIRQ